MGRTSLTSSLFIICTVMMFHASYAAIDFSYTDGFRTLYGGPNVNAYGEKNESVQIRMDERTSSGFRSKHMYGYGFFGASLKLPPQNYTAGVVVSLYTSNHEKYPYMHDEIDFEFLGHVDGQEWLVQTNYYGNGDTRRGREERYKLWFDPSKDFHTYDVFWTGDTITYRVDGYAISHVNVTGAHYHDFPSKTMALYGTIWNGSNWATNGGWDKLDLSHGPYVANFKSFYLPGCDLFEDCGDYDELQPWIGGLSEEDIENMEGFRANFMTYSYCHDKKRYAVPLPECVFSPGEGANLQKVDPGTTTV